MNGEEFRKIREELGLSREKLASKFGVSSATIANAERSDTVRDVYATRLLTLRAPAVALPEADPPAEALAAYNSLVAAAATLYRLAKIATAPPARPVGRPPSKSPLLAADTPEGRNAARDRERPLIAARVLELQQATPERRRYLITTWSLSTPERQTHLRAWVNAMTVGAITNMDDPLVTLPPEAP